MELAALDQFKKSLNLLLENYSKYFDDLLSGERSLPFGLLVNFHGEVGSNKQFPLKITVIDMSFCP